MKKWIVRISMVFALALMLSVTAFAEGADGIQTPAVKNEFVTIVPKGTDQVKVTYSAAESGKEYLVIVTEGSGTPTESNIVYINQMTAKSSEVTFDVYPSSLKNATYSVRISSSASSGIQKLEEVGTFENKVSFTRGDVHPVNKPDGKINTLDALAVVNHFVGRTPLTGNSLQAADVAGGADNRGDGKVNTLDALKIVNCFVGRIKPNEI